MLGLKRKYLEYRRRRALQNFRAFAALNGHDLSNLSDEEVEQMILDAQRRISEFGFSAAEAGAAFTKLGQTGRSLAYTISQISSASAESL